MKKVGLVAALFLLFPSCAVKKNNILRCRPVVMQVSNFGTQHGKWVHGAEKCTELTKALKFAAIVFGDKLQYGLELESGGVIVGTKIRDLAADMYTPMLPEAPK